MKYNAVKVTSMKDLETTVKGHAAVILIDNANISKKVKEISDHDVKMQTKSNKMLKTGGISAGAAVGLLVIGAVGETFFAPIGVVCGLGALASYTVSFVSLTMGAGKKILNAITTELKDYKWFESNKKVVLYKYRGVNKFDPETDEVIGYKKD